MCIGHAFTISKVLQWIFTWTTLKKRTQFWCRHFGICEIISEKRDFFMFLWKCIFVEKKKISIYCKFPLSKCGHWQSLVYNFMKCWNTKKIFEFCQQKNHWIYFFLGKPEGYHYKSYFDLSRKAVILPERTTYYNLVFPDVNFEQNVERHSKWKLHSVYIWICHKKVCFLALEKKTIKKFNFFQLNMKGP